MRCTGCTVPAFDVHERHLWPWDVVDALTAMVVEIIFEARHSSTSTSRAVLSLPQ